VGSEGSFVSSGSAGGSFQRHPLPQSRPHAIHSAVIHSAAPTRAGAVGAIVDSSQVRSRATSLPVELTEPEPRQLPRDSLFASRGLIESRDGLFESRDRFELRQTRNRFEQGSVAAGSVAAGSVAAGSWSAGSWSAGSGSADFGDSSRAQEAQRLSRGSAKQIREAYQKGGALPPDPSLRPSDQAVGDLTAGSRQSAVIAPSAPPARPAPSAPPAPSATSAASAANAPVPVTVTANAMRRRATAERWTLGQGSSNQGLDKDDVVAWMLSSKPQRLSKSEVAISDRRSGCMSHVSQLAMGFEAGGGQGVGSQTLVKAPWAQRGWVHKG